MIRKLAIMLLAAALLLSAAISANAAQAPVEMSGCSLTLLMEWEGEPLNSGSLTIYRVAEIEDNRFVLVPELRDSGLSLENLNSAELAQSLCVLAEEMELPGTTATIENGKAVFAGLQPGLYLVTQEQDQASDGFSAIRPFLLSVPQVKNGVYHYHVTATPKMALEPLPTQPTTPTTPPPPTVPVLPQTGQLNWPVPVMAVAGLALIALGAYLCFGKKSGHES